MDRGAWRATVHGVTKSNTSTFQGHPKALFSFSRTEKEKRAGKTGPPAPRHPALHLLWPWASWSCPAHLGRAIQVWWGQGAEMRGPGGVPVRGEFHGNLWTKKRPKAEGWGLKLKDRQINGQSPSSLKVISQLSIDCHQVTAIYNHSSPSQLSAALGRELLCPRAQSTEPALSREQSLRLPCPPPPPACTDPLRIPHF